MGRTAAPSLVFSMLIGLLSLRGNAALESGVYQTLPGATVEEHGDRVPNGSRVVPLSATITFDLNATPPSLVAVAANAVLEGGDPFALTVRSASGVSLIGGAYHFAGDYLQAIEPSGTQYLFEWRFSASTSNEVIWNGTTGWAGGHYWELAISNLTLVPAALVSISRSATTSVQVSWDMRFSDRVLEWCETLPGGGWNAVTNQVATNANRLSVTVEPGESRRFYRLHPR